MIIQPTKLSRTMTCGGIILLFAGMILFAGCSSDDSTPLAPAPVITDPAQGMERMRDAVGGAVGMVPDGDLADGIPLDDETLAALMAMMADLGFELPTNGDMPDIPPVGEIDEIIYGLHVRGSWNLNEEAMNLTADLRVSGTVAGLDEFTDGTALDVTVRIRIAGGTGTVNLGGWVTPPGEQRVQATLNVTLSDAGSDKRIQLEARATQAGVELLFSNVTALVNQTTGAATINGTVRIIDEEYAAHRTTVTFADLRTDADGELTSGQVVVFDSATGLTTALTVQPDGSLSGPVRDNQGNIVGFMTVVDGEVTVTPV